MAAMLVITTHGILRECSLSHIERAIIPPDLNIVALEATPCGIVNLIGDEDLDIMDELLKKFRPDKIKKRNAKKVLIKSAIEMKKMLNDMSKEIQRETLKSEDPQIFDFARSSLYNIYDYNITAPNEKEFLVYQKDITSETHPYNWKISLVFKGEDAVDVLDLCFRTRSHRKKEEGVKLSFILECIKTHYPELKNLLILDLSCNNLDNDECYMKDKHDEEVTNEEGNLIVDPRIMRRVKNTSLKERLPSIISKGKHTKRKRTKRKRTKRTKRKSK